MDIATSMDECGSSHDVVKHALNLHSSKEIDLIVDCSRFVEADDHCTH